MEIKIVDQKSEIAVVYKERTTMENITAVMDRGFGKTFGYLKALGKYPTGAPFCRYTNGNSDYSEFDCEIGFPVAEAVEEKDGVYMTETYEGKSIEGMHKGPYGTLEETYSAMMKYVAENKLEMTGVYYDWYLNDPDETPENELLTRIVFPIK